MKRAIFVLIFSLCVQSLLLGDAPAPMMLQDESQELIVYNRILAKVNGKTISVIDVMKRMDLFLQHHYPHLVSSKVARFQYYNSQWRETLAQIIDQELMLADSERLEIKVSEAEIREEMLTRFGPNIIQTLDNMNLTHEEARKMIVDEMIVQRMMWYRVNAKALNTVNPRDIKTAYHKHCEKNPALEEWRYQVLSVRAADKALSEALAHKAFDILQQKHLEFATLPQELNTQMEATSEGMNVALSPELQADEKSISASHKEALKSLTPGAISPPIAQVNRIDNTVVYRIFHLIEHTKKTLPSFESMADKLKDELLQEAFDKGNAHYIARLRQRLGYDEKHMLETLPPDFQPFNLR